jgi:Peptidase family M28
MRAAETAARLTEFERRGAGTDAERRAAVWLAGELRSTRRHAYLETFWHRPNWALGHAWHCLIAIAGSLLMVSHAKTGGALVLVALISTIADGLTGHSIGRRLTREHASQNVISPAPPTASRSPGALRAGDPHNGDPHSGDRQNGDPRNGDPRNGDPATGDPDIRLIVTANYDAGRTGLAYRTPLRTTGARLKRIAGRGRFTPGWIGWLTIELVWLLAVAVLRNAGAAGTTLGIAQLIPTAALVLELALLLDLSGAPFGPAAGDNAAGAAVAVSLTRALDAAPPRRLGVELVLQGSGEAAMTGLRRHLRARRRERRPANTVVLGIGPCGAGRPRWWVSDGSLVPLRYPARLRDLAARTGGAPVALNATAHFGHGISPAFPARAAGIPALTIGCVDDRGLAPRSHQAGDRPEALDPGALDRVLEFALMLVDAIDADLASTLGHPGPRHGEQTPAPLPPR